MKNEEFCKKNTTFARAMRYFITFAYDGTRYHGWQLQPDAHSVQAELQQALSTLLRGDVEVVGAGRTDAGVHARKMVAHFDWDGQLECDQLAYRLNKLLPRDIAVHGVESVDEQLHARFSATSRTYHYYIHTVKDPFARAYSLELHYKLDFEAMNRAAERLLEFDDFGAFCKSHTDVKTTICHVTESRWIAIDESHWYFRITANRFLRNMVRAVVGTLIEVGRGRMSQEDFIKIINQGKRTAAGESMPAHALFLEDVKYQDNKCG